MQSKIKTAANPTWDTVIHAKLASESWPRVTRSFVQRPKREKQEQTGPNNAETKDSDSTKLNKMLFSLVTILVLIYWLCTDGRYTLKYLLSFFIVRPLI